MPKTISTGREQFVVDATAALAYRADGNTTIDLSAGQQKLASRP